jgi:hypothetical protein
MSGFKGLFFVSNSTHINISIQIKLQLFKEFPPIDQKLLEKVHSKQHLDSLQTIKSMSQEDVNKFSDQFHAVNLTKVSICCFLNYNACLGLV